MAHILIVDDTESVRAILQAALARAGHTITAAASRAAGVEAIMSGNTFDVLILDFELGDGFGTELFAEAIAHAPTLAGRTVFVTGRPSAEPAIREAAPAAAVLLKPFDLEALVAQVDVLAATSPRQAEQTSVLHP